MKTFKTPKGTELPLMSLKGKDYLQVAYRVVWFREEYPLGRITTERISESDKHVSYRATIAVPEGSSYEVLANADKTVHIKSTLDYEKCETAAIGRALALCGYGTQFAEDIEESDILPDAPLEPKKNTQEVKYAKEKLATINKPKTDSGISEPQRKRLFAIANECGWDQPRIKQFMKVKLGIESTKDLTPMMYDFLCNAIEHSPRTKGEEKPTQGGN